MNVTVELMNDDGAVVTVDASGATVDDAVARAEKEARRLTQDDSYVMSDWKAA